MAKILLSDGDHETAEDAAKAIIRWLDEDRAKRTSYMGLLIMGSIAIGIGPYPGQKGAEKALTGHPAASEASRLVVAQDLAQRR